jgi:hypothetical protein
VSRAAVPVLVWAALLTVLASVLWIWTPDHLPPAIFSGAAGITWVLGLLVLLRRRPPSRVRAAPDLSLASAMVALAVALMVIGALLGPWLVLIGAGALAVGLGGVGRELVAQRRTVR